MAPAPGQEQPIKKVAKIVDWLYNHDESEPFREPVDWKEMGLFDYPQIISKMMDLGTIKRKITRGQYQTAHAVAEDTKLVFINCMTYNAEESDFWMLAKKFLRRFEDRYRKVRKEYDVGENYATETPSKSQSGRSSRSSSAKDASDTSYVVAPCSSTQNLDARAQFGSNLFLLSGSELGHVMTRIEKECPEALETWGREKVEVNIDALPSKLFSSLQEYIRGKIGSTRYSTESTGGSRSKKRKR